MVSQVSSQSESQPVPPSSQEFPSPGSSSLKILCWTDDILEIVLGILSADRNPFWTLIGAALVGGGLSRSIDLKEMDEIRSTITRPNFPARMWNQRVRSLVFSAALTAGLLFTEQRGFLSGCLRNGSSLLLGAYAVMSFSRRALYPVLTDRPPSA